MVIKIYTERTETSLSMIEDHPEDTPIQNIPIKIQKPRLTILISKEREEKGKAIVWFTII